ncbi:hypothetical protein JOM56_000078 [Amanita muscaria]
MAPRSALPEEAAQASGPRLARTAKAKALQNKVWQEQGSVRRKRTESNSDQLPRSKEARIQQSSASQGKTVRAARRLPPGWSDYDSEDNRRTTELPQKISGKKKQPSTRYSEELEDFQDDMDGDEEDEEEGADANEDLEDLDDRHLTETLQSEAVQWARPKHKRAPHNDDDEVTIPNENELTTASENDRFQGDREDLPSEEESDKESEDDGGGQKKNKLDKRADARRSELPHWARVYKKYQGGSREKAAVAMGFVSPGKDVDDYHKQSKQWWAAPYCSPGPGQRIISLKMQPRVLQEILAISIRQVTGDAMFVSAYVSIDELPGYLVGIVIAAASKAEHGEAYATRLDKDVMLKVDIVRLLNNRLSIYRSKTKKIARGIVELKYFLDSDQVDRKSQIMDLIKNSRFIFASKQNSQEVDRSRPFQHPAMLRVLQDVYFSGRRGQSLGHKHASRFASSIKEGVASRELEVPPAMVAMAATAVHASLEDFVGKQDFSADLYEDIYCKHITFLDQIRDASVRRYHRLMSDLYLLVSNSTTPATDLADNDAMQILAIGDMPE